MSKQVSAHTQFIAMMKELRSYGLKPAHVAKLLGKARGSMSQYSSGYAAPSKAVLELLRRIVEEKRVGTLDGFIVELAKKLNKIKVYDPLGYEMFKESIERNAELLLANSNVAKIKRKGKRRPFAPTAPHEILTPNILKGFRYIGKHSIGFECPACGLEITRETSAIGQITSCTICSKKFRIPKDQMPDDEDYSVGASAA